MKSEGIQQEAVSGLLDKQHWNHDFIIFPYCKCVGKAKDIQAIIMSYQMVVKGTLATWIYNTYFISADKPYLVKMWHPSIAVKMNENDIIFQNQE